MTPDQTRFLVLHARHVVTRHAERWQGAILVAITDRGRTATLARQEVADLVAAGLIKRSHGVSVAITDAGRMVLQEEMAL